MLRPKISEPRKDSHLLGFSAIEASKHFITLPRTLHISKNFVAYIEALAQHPTTRRRMNKLDTRFATAFKELNVSSDLTQRDDSDPEEGTARTGGADGEDDPDGEEEETVALSLSGGE